MWERERVYVRTREPYYAYHKYCATVICDGLVVCKCILYSTRKKTCSIFFDGQKKQIKTFPFILKSQLYLNKFFSWMKVFSSSTFQGKFKFGLFEIYLLNCCLLLTTEISNSWQQKKTIEIIGTKKALLKNPGRCWEKNHNIVYFVSDKQSLRHFYLICLFLFLK